MIKFSHLQIQQNRRLSPQGPDRRRQAHPCSQQPNLQGMDPQDVGKSICYNSLEIHLGAPPIVPL